MLKIENVSYTYKGKNASPVLRDISLELGEGFTFLVGENGSGKTTIIKLITGILPLTSGSVSAGDVPVGAAEYRKKLSYLPQVFDIYPQLKVREVLSFVAGLKGVSENISEVAEITGVGGFLDKKMKQCSEGMRRRVGIAATLIGDPEIVIMDEPTAGIDPKERISFYKTVKECFAGKTVLISTHVLSDVDYLADSVAMLSGGKLAYDGGYSEYRHALDGRVFSIDCSARELDALSELYTVLSTQKSGESYLCHVLTDSEAAAAELTPTEATIEDVWLFYERQV